MALYSFPAVATRQPLSPLPLAKTSLTARLSKVITPAWLKAQANNKTISVVGNPVLQSGLGGLYGWKFDGASQYIDLGPMPSGKYFTLLVYAIQGTSTGFSLTTRSSSSDQGIEILHGEGAVPGNVTARNLGAFGGGDTPAIASSTADPHIFIATFDQDVAARLYIDRITNVQTVSVTGGGTITHTQNLLLALRAATSNYWAGHTFLAVAWDRALTVNEVQELLRNPWQIFEDPLAWAYYTPDGAAGVTGTLAQTLANATLSASGNQTILGTLSQTLANTAPNISGTTAILGSIGLNLSATILAASGSVGAAVSGTTAQTLANTTLSASGTTTVRGTVASTLAAVTSAISGTTNILGAVANTLSNVTLAASGAVGNAVAGTITGNLANVTLAASGNVTVRGSVSYTTENTTLSSSGTTQVQGTLGVTLAPTTLAAFGTSGSPVLSTAWRFLKLWMSKLGF